jgi:hypothetical protein
MTIERSFNTDRPLRIDVKAPAGQLTVEPGEPGTTTVTADPEEVRVELTGDELVVEAPPRRFGLVRIDRGIRVRITTPPGAFLRVSGASLSVVARLPLAGAELQNASGDIRLAGVEGAARVKTVSGDVVLGPVTGPLEAQSVSGDIKVASAAEDVHATSVSGDIRLEEIVSGIVNARTVSGDISVLARPGTRLLVDASTVSGRPTSDLPLSDGPTGDSGPQAELHLRATSGDIRVGRARPHAATR